MGNKFQKLLYNLSAASPVFLVFSIVIPKSKSLFLCEEGQQQSKNNIVY